MLFAVLDFELPEFFWWCFLAYGALMLFKRAGAASWDTKKAVAKGGFNLIRRMFK